MQRTFATAVLTRQQHLCSGCGVFFFATNALKGNLAALAERDYNIAVKGGYQSSPRLKVSLEGRTDDEQKGRMRMRKNTAAADREIKFSDYLDMCARDAFGDRADIGAKSRMNSEGNLTPRMVIRTGKSSFIPGNLLNKNYSLEKLCATKLPKSGSLKQLGQRIADALGEVSADGLIEVVEVIGRREATRIFEECKQIEKQGGLSTALRRRSPGGVFFYQVYEVHKLIKNPRAFHPTPAMATKSSVKGDS